MRVIEPEAIGLVPASAAVSIYEALKSGEVKFDKQGMVEIDRRSEVAHVMQETHIDFQGLLQYAHKSYQISNDPKDYVIVPVPIILTDTPNRNGVAFPAKETASFSPTHGMPFFKTWGGKPTFAEHDNKDYTKAKGIILDVTMNKIRDRPGFWKINTLLAYDRTKDKQLYSNIIKRKINSYSMGAYVGQYRCSLCKRTYEGAKPACSHLDSKRVNFAAINENLLYKEALWIEGFEVSSVAVPAYRAAISDYISVVDPQLRQRLAA